MSAQLFVDAVHTANALVAAARWWGIFAAALCVFVIPTAIGGLAWGVDALRGRLDGPVAAEDAAPAPEPHPRRRVPSWACQQPLDDYDEAA